MTDLVSRLRTLTSRRSAGTQPAAPDPEPSPGQFEAVVLLTQELLRAIEQFVISNSDLDTDRFARRLQRNAAVLTPDVDSGQLTGCLEWTRSALPLFARLQREYLIQRESEMWRLLDIHVEVSGQSEGRGQDLLQQLTHAHDRISKASSLDDIRAARAVMEQELVHARRTLAEKAKDDRDRAQRLARQVSRLDEELSSVRGQADYDVLTQLLHQRAFMHQLRRAMEGGKVCSLAYLDLDDFKTINDALGHLVGDRLLAFVAGQLRGLGRSVDILSRHAADEFCFAAPGYSAEQLSQRLAPLASRRDVQLELDDRVCSALLSVSIGIAQSGPLETAESLMRRAEWALAAAKRHGRSTIRLAPPSAGPNHEGHG